MEPTPKPELALSRKSRFGTPACLVAQPLHGYLLRQADPGQVDDVLAEAMLVLWRGLDDVPGMAGDAKLAADDVLPWVRHACSVRAKGIRFGR